MAADLSRVDPLIRLVALRLPAIAKKYGVSVRVTSAYRSPEKQARLYAEYKAGRAPYVVAAPGTSRHERGLAIDMTTDNLQWLVELMTILGFRWAGFKDPVHFEL